MFSCIPGLYTLGSRSSSLSAVTTKHASRHYRLAPSGTKSSLVENHWATSFLNTYCVQGTEWCTWIHLSSQQPYKVSIPPFYRWGKWSTKCIYYNWLRLLLSLYGFLLLLPIIATAIKHSLCQALCFTLLSFTTTLCSRHHKHLHFTDEKTEVQLAKCGAGIPSCAIWLAALVLPRSKIPLP